MRTASFALIVAFASALTHGASAATVSVTGGIIRGEDLPDGSAVYRAIPYAAPPLGDLRWKPPAPVIPWRGARNAVDAPRPCLQENEGWNAAAAASGSEDCLYLSLHTPRHGPGPKLPVFVWIHGGSNRAGSGFGVADSPIYKRGLIIVGVEYRLGVFGFLGAPELTAESPHHSSGNYGLLDQIAALQWVKANIARFGGDPGNVTVGGQSAGAIDVGQLMRSPLARGLFDKVIQESGAPGMPRSARDSQRIGSDFLAGLHLPPTARGLAALRTLPAETVLASAAAIMGREPNSDVIWVASHADGWLLPGSTNNIWTDGAQARVPLLIGDNTREIIVAAQDGGRGLIRSIYGSNADRALALYGFKGAAQPPEDPVLGNAATQAMTDFAFRCGTNREALWQVKAGVPVWRYQFGLPRPGTRTVQHTAELDYVFNAAPGNATLQSWPPLQQYWANFIRSGDPNAPGLPAWPQMGSALHYLAFLPDGARPGADLQGPICRLMADTMAGR